MKRKIFSLFVIALAVASCQTRAQHSAKVEAQHFDDYIYQGWDCERMQKEDKEVSFNLATAKGAQDKAATHDTIARWVPYMGYTGGKPEELANLKGRRKTLHDVMTKENCPIAE